IPGQPPDQRAEYRVQGDHGKPDDDGKLRAPNHAGPQAPTEIVRPEREVGTSRTMPKRPSPERNSRWWNKRFSVAPAGCSRVKGISASNSSSARPLSIPLSMAHPRVEQGVAHIHGDID